MARSRLPDPELHDFVPRPFRLDDTEAYLSWRDEKLCFRRPGLSELLVNIDDPYKLSDTEKGAISERCHRYNMVIYQLADPHMTDKSLVHALGSQLAMGDLDFNIRADKDSVTSLEVRSQAGNQYIPYTNKALSWHTDGYYNRLDKQIFGIIMHCVAPAYEGGVNALLDPEQVYIALRDKDPAYIEALMHPQAMTIPDNVEDGVVIRPEQPGPVLSIRPGGRLHMRFSARKRNIIWRDTPETGAAVAMMNSLMSDQERLVRISLGAGQGIICNNVLHNRSSFTDSASQKRLMYRARYYGGVTCK